MPAAAEPPSPPSAPLVSRRALLALGATVLVGACTGGDDSAPTTAGRPATTPPPSTPLTIAVPTIPATIAPAASGAPTTTVAASGLRVDPFALGVSAGDPDATSAVLWTRLVGTRRAPLPREVDVVWELATDREFRSVVDSGAVVAEQGEGHSVHVEAQLDGRAFYRFRAGGHTSPVGVVAPTGAAGPLRLATASCQHWETGRYAAHRDIAEWRPDLVVFLGDFIYEGARRPLGEGRVRQHRGAEPTDLASYRERYEQYLGDGQLRRARAVCPWLVIWDDHEVENNYAGLHPDDDDPEAASAFAVRRALAYQAWWEHMPVRLPRPPAPPDDATTGALPEPYDINRTIRWGDLTEIAMLDGRQFRSDQACNDVTLSTDPPCAAALDPVRTMLGGDQEEWIGDVLARADARWTVVAQQTVMTDLRLPNGAILNFDQWDGYAPARERLLEAASAPERVVVLTGDIHLAGVGRLPGVGVEFVTTSISSESNLPPDLTAGALLTFPDVVAAEVDHRGYIRHTIDEDRWTAEYRTVDDVGRADSPVSTWKTFRVEAAHRDRVNAV